MSFLVTLLLPAAGAGAAGTALSEDCFAELEAGKGSEIACLFPIRLTEQERADLRRITRQYMDDLTCRMTIRIARKSVDEALAAADHIFQSPEQPVTCTIKTPKSTFDVTATFAPRVVFKGDKAVEASPGLGNVKGVSRIISWPVVFYVNKGANIRTAMLQIINAYRDFSRKKKQAGAVP
jgi:hypothetical protein